MSSRKRIVNVVDDILREVLNNRSIVPIIGNINSDYKVSYNILSPKKIMRKSSKLPTISDPLTGLYTSLRPLFIKTFSRPHSTSILIPLWYFYFAKLSKNYNEIDLYTPDCWVKYPYSAHYEVRIGDVRYIPYNYDPDEVKQITYSDNFKASVEVYSPYRINYLDFDYIPAINPNNIEDESFPSLLIYTNEGNKKHLKHLLIFMRDANNNSSNIPVCASLDSKIVFIGVTCEKLSKYLDKDNLNDFINSIKICLISKSSKRECLYIRQGIESVKTFDDLVKLFKSVSLVATRLYLDKSELKQLFPFNDQLDQLYTIYLINNVNIVRYIYGYRIRFKTFSYYYSTPVIFYDKDRKSRGYGYTIYNTKGIQITIDKKELKKILYGILVIDNELYRILRAKYILYKNSFSHVYSSYLGGYINYEKISGIVRNSNLGNLQSNYNMDDFIEFVITNAAYSLTYLFMRAISSILNTSIDNFILYLDMSQNDSIKIYILEKSSEGLGFTETMINQIFSNNNNMKRFYDLIISTLYKDDIIDTKNDTCQIRFSKTQLDYGNRLNKISAINNDIKEISKYAEEVINEWEIKVKTDFPWDFLRNVVLDYIHEKNNKLYSSIVNNQILKSSMEIIYGKYSKVCWDGCMQCIRLPEENGLLQPDFEIFLTSRRLGARLIEVLRSYLLPHSITTVNNYKDTLLNLLGNAKRVIILVSPFFDDTMKEIFDKLLSKVNESNSMRIIIFTRENSYKEHKDIFEKIRKFAKIYYIDNLHSKIYIIDNIILWGSANLTSTSLQRNVETLTQTDALHVLYNILGDFIQKTKYRQVFDL